MRRPYPAPRPATVVAMTAARLHGIPPTIFTEMSALAVRTGAVNLGQGFPDTDGPHSVIARAVAALRGRWQPVRRPAPASPPCAGHRPPPAAVLRPRALDPDTQVVVTTGCTEAIAAAVLGLVNPGRRGDRPGALLRLLRRDGADGRRRTPTGDAAGPGLPARPGGAGAGCLSPHPVPPAQHPAQPHRHRAATRGAAGPGRRRDRARPGRDHRRGLRAPDLRRPPPRPDGDPAGHVRAHADPVQLRASPTPSPAGRSAGRRGRPTS